VEALMPHRQTKKGSFGNNVDELVKHFPQDGPRPRSAGSRKRDGDEDDGSVHDKLFERSWHAQRKNG
jgi:hypothetical protein